jgi:uncharacterized protein
VDAKERVIRELYEARARKDWDAVRSLLTDDVGWHDPGDEDHAGDFHGADKVLELIQKLDAVTDGTFQLEPSEFLNLQEHSATLVSWRAERDGRRSEGKEIAVFRMQDGKVAEVWFYNEPSDREVFPVVFAFE